MNGDQIYLERSSPKHPCVYRFFDADGALLYVGVTMSVLSRMMAHRRLPWYREIATIKVEHHDTKELAFAAERAAIAAENPRYNLYETGEYEYYSPNTTRKRNLDADALRRQALKADYERSRASREAAEAQAAEEKKNRLIQVADIDRRRMEKAARMKAADGNSCSTKTAAKVQQFLQDTERMKKLGDSA